MASRLNAHYENEVRKALMEKFGYKSPMEIPTPSESARSMERLLTLPPVTSSTCLVRT